MSRYALIDNDSGYVWGVLNAETPIAAAAAMDADIGGEPRAYDAVSRLDGQSGYRVYEVPAGFDVDDGQNPAEIERVKAAGHLVECVAFRRAAA